MWYLVVCSLHMENCCLNRKEKEKHVEFVLEADNGRPMVAYIYIYLALREATECQESLTKSKDHFESFAFGWHPPGPSMPEGRQACARMTHLMPLTQNQNLLCRPCGRQSHSAQQGPGLQGGIAAHHEPCRNSLMRLWERRGPLKIVQVRLNSFNHIHIILRSQANTSRNYA